MNKNIKLRCAVFLLSCAFLLMGCQLAVPEADMQKRPDRLIGVYITREYIDTVDWEAFVDDNVESLVGNLQVTLPLHSANQERIYAQVADGAITFPNLEGMLLVNYWKEQGTEGYWTSDFSEGLQDIHNEYHSLDTGSRIRQTANIFLPYDVGEICFYMNPVYQTEDQEIYLLPGTGSAMGTSFGGELRLTVSEETVLTEDGEESLYNAEFEIVVDCVEIPEKVVLTQMDQNSQVLKIAEYLPENMPETLIPENGTAYILIETYVADKIFRSINQPDGESIAVFIRGENNICTRKYTEVNWK